MTPFQRLDLLVVRLQSREALSAGVLYAIVLAGVYCPVVFGGRSLHAPLYYPGGVLETGPHGDAGRRPLNVFDVDLATSAYYEPGLNGAVARAWSGTEWPLWNPYQGAGTPLAAQYSSRAFFPYQILVDLAPAGAWDFFALGRLWVAGFSTWLFMRLLGAGRSARFLAGLLFMLCGTFVWFVNLEQMVNVAFMTPVLLWAVERLWTRPWTRGVPLLSGVIALVFLAGQPEVALFVFILSFAYALFRVARTPSGERRGRLCALAGCAVLGMALAAPLLLPFHEYVGSAHHIHPPGGDMGVQDPVEAKHATAIAAPSRRMREVHVRQLPDNGRWDELGGYLGFTSVCLNLLGLALLASRSGHGAWRGPFLFFFSFGVLLLLKNFGFPLLQWIGRLPLLDQAWGPRWAGPAWTFPLSVSAGLALDGLLDVDASRPRAWALRLRDRFVEPVARAFRGMGFGLPVLLLVLVGARMLWWSGKLLDGETQPPTAMPLRMLQSSAFSVVAVSAVLAFVFLVRARLRHAAPLAGFAFLAAGELGFAVPWGYAPADALCRVVPFALLLVAAVAAARSRVEWSWAAAGAAVLLAAAIDRRAPYGPPGRVDPARPAPYVRFLQSRPDLPRVMGGDGVLMPNTAGALGLHDVHYITALTDRALFDFTSRHLRSEPLWPQSSASHWFTGLGWADVVGADGEPVRRYLDFGRDFLERRRFYSLLGVRYVVTPRDYAWPTADDSALSPEGEILPLPRVYRDEVAIYENAGAFPRAWVAHHVQVEPTREAVLARIADPALDLRATAVLEGPLSPGMAAAAERLSEPAGRVASRIRVATYRMNTLRLETTTDREGLLVLADVFGPGWTARVDGAPAEIVRVDGLLRGVLLPAGTHTVRFRYFPRSFAVGLGIAGSAAALCLLLFGASVLAGAVRPTRTA